MRRDWTDAHEKVASEGRCRLYRSGCCEGQLQHAHVAGRRFDPKDGRIRAVDVVPLCRKHHETFDSHRLNLLPYLDYAEQAAAVEHLGIERARRRLTGERDV